MLCSTPRCKLACVLPPSSLDPRLSFRSVSLLRRRRNRDRFIGDGGPLNSRERSIGRAHLPCCPRLRRTILGRSETVLITIRDAKNCFYWYEVPPSRVTKQVICPRIPRSWLEHLDDEKWDVVDTEEIESWVSQDLRKSCISVEPVSEPHHCQIGMTAIVTGDVNAVYTLECAHSRQLLAARSLHEQSLLIRGHPFPRTKTIGDVFFDDLVILSVLQFSYVHLDSSAHRSSANRCFV